MSFLAYGINHRTAPIAIRERIAFNPKGVSNILRAWAEREAVNEAVLLSTCNRTEIYTISEFKQKIQCWLHSQVSRQEVEIASFCYLYEGIDAVRHLMRVASGLDSMVLGEAQILSQVKQAYFLAHETGTIGKQLQHLFPAVFSASKQIRSKTTIGKNPISISYATVQLIKRIFSKINRCQVLLIGAGSIIELIATYLYECGVKKIMIANRTPEKAQLLSEQFNGHAIRITDIPAYLKDVDIVVSATMSQLPILGKGMIESALKYKKRRPLFMADLAVPRDIEPEAGMLEDVYLYNIDDLQSVIAQNLKNREEAAKQAEAMVEMRALNYIRQRQVLNASNIIRDYRKKVEDIRTQEVAKAIDQLQRGQYPPTILNNLSYNLINKIMHVPTVKLRQAAYNEQNEILILAKELFEL